MRMLTEAAAAVQDADLLDAVPDCFCGISEAGVVGTGCREAIIRCLALFES